MDVYPKLLTSLKINEENHRTTVSMLSTIQNTGVTLGKLQERTLSDFSWGRPANRDGDVQAIVSRFILAKFDPSTSTQHLFLNVTKIFQTDPQNLMV